MSTQKILFYGELEKTFPELSSTSPRDTPIHPFVVNAITSWTVRALDLKFDMCLGYIYRYAWAY